MMAIARTIRKGMAAGVLALSATGLASSPALAGAKSPPPSLDATFENVTVELPALRLRIPKIEIKGANLAKPEIEKLFAASNTAPLAARLKDFSAESVSIPMVDYSLEIGTFRASGTYDGARFEKIAAGRIAKAAYSGGKAHYIYRNTFGDDVTIDTTAGGVSFSDINLINAIRLWEDKAGPANKDALAVIGNVASDGIHAEAVSPTVTLIAGSGKVAMTDSVKIKPLSRPLKDIAADLAAAYVAISTKDEDPAKFQQFKAGMRGLVELIDNYQVPAIVVDGCTFSRALREPGANAPESLTAKAGRIELGPKLMQIGAFDIAVPDEGRFRIGSISLKDFSLAPFLANLRAVLSGPNDMMSAQTGRMTGISFYANLGTLSFNDIDADLLAGRKRAIAAEGDDGTAAPQTKPESAAIKVRVKGVTVRAEKPVNGIFPSSIRLAVDNAQVPTAYLAQSGEPDDEKLAERVKQLGYDSFNVSYAVDMNWNEAASELAINEIRVGEETAGSMLFKGTIGNFTRDMFALDANLAPDTRRIQATAIGLLAKDLSLHVEDRGIVDRVAEQQGKLNGTSAAEWKAAVVTMLFDQIPPALAELPSVKTVKQAALAFWNKPGRLDIAVRARNGVGLGLADMLAASQAPASIEPKIEVSAQAK